DPVAQPVLIHSAKWWRRRESKAQSDSASTAANPAGNKVDPQRRPSEPTEPNVGTPSVETLRGKLDAAIVAERWDAVAAISARITEVGRADVIDFRAARAKRARSFAVGLAYAPRGSLADRTIDVQA